MATRLYFGNGTAPISPSFDASWEATGTPTRRPLEPDKGLSDSAFESIAVATTLNSPAGAVDVAIAQYVSAPLNGAQTISGAIKGQVRASESNAAADMRIQTVIRVLSNDGTTVRGTLIASNAGALSHEFNTSLRNISVPLGGSTSPSSVNAQDGDRIVVEIGYRKHENATTSRTGTLRLGNPSGTDLAEDETTTTDNVPWIEFADTLAFQTIPARQSQTVAQVAALPVPAVRVSQTVIQAAIAQPVTLRVSQTVLQVAVLPSSVPAATPRSWGTIIG